MSKTEWEKIQKVGTALEGFKALEELLGEAPVVQLSDEALQKWHDFEKQYDKFYQLDIAERLKYAGMLSKASS